MDSRASRSPSWLPASRSRRAPAASASRASSCASKRPPVGARAERGGNYLRETLATDEGAARLGEIGIGTASGTNDGIRRATGNIRLDEKIGGTVHLALGRSYPETGGVNVSAVHWDLICDPRDEGRPAPMGQTLMQDGRFTCWT